MGLDIYFNRAKAEAAGLKVTMEPNGDSSERDPTLYDPDFIDWLNEVHPTVEIPYVNYYVRAFDVKDNLCIRANKWGSTYAPLTQWLRRNDIDWYEA